jgi:hypothetical protein
VTTASQIDAGWVGQVSARSPIVPRFMPAIASKPQHHEEQTVVRSSATLIGWTGPSVLSA